MLPWLTPFMRGKCFDFALALGEAVECPRFVAVGSAEYPDHVALELEGGLYADVRGILTAAQLLDGIALSQGEGQPIVSVGRNLLERHCGLSGMEPPYHGSEDIEEARAAVREVFPDGMPPVASPVMP